MALETGIISEFRRKFMFLRVIDTIRKDCNFM